MRISKRLSFVSISAILIFLASFFSGCGILKDNLTRGTTTNNTYVNQSIGVTFNLPSMWRFYTDAELAEASNVAYDLFDNELVAQSAKVSSFIDFMAINSVTGDNVNLCVENPKFINRFLPIEKLVENVKKTMQTQQSSISYTFSDNVQKTLGENEYIMFTAYANYNGVNMNQYVYLRKVEKRLITITATSTSNNATYFEQMFSSAI